MKQTSQGWELSFSIGYDAIVNVDVVFELTHKLSQHSTSVLRLKEEVLAGGWESLESGEIDILFSTLPERPLPQHIQTMHIYSDTMVWAANPDYANRLNLNNNRKWTDATLVVIPDTAKTYAKESRNLDAHQSKRFYAANINNKKQAIVASIGIGTLPKCMIEQEDLVNLGTSKSVDIYAAWSRSNMGKTKALALQALRNLANKDLFST
ncbi:transcriptional regulator LysR family [Vibrio maritimus]|uniref:Transcriptional regulator LysR family n=1 Tax=Vibrio maritimus TaxID=990268 RepID=A0A090U3B8_9VIBR|nr:transcriptional regulator LysR family [Vibrio maritimus]